MKSMVATTKEGRHGLTALVAKTEIKTAGLITSLAMLMATSTIPIGNKPLTPMAMVLAITTAWIAVQPALTRTPTAGTSSLTSLPNTVIMTAMDTVITTLTPSTAITVRGTLGHHSETETVALTAMEMEPVTHLMKGHSLSGTFP